MWPWAWYLLFSIYEMEIRIPASTMFVLQIKWHNASKAFRECMFRKWQHYDYILPTSKFLGSQCIRSQRQITFSKHSKNSPVHRATLGAPCLELSEKPFPILLRDQIQATLPNTDFNEWLALGVTSGALPTSANLLVWHWTWADLIHSLLKTKQEDSSRLS